MDAPHPWVNIPTNYENTVLIYWHYILKNIHKILSPQLPKKLTIHKILLSKIQMIGQYTCNLKLLVMYINLLLHVWCHSNIHIFISDVLCRHIKHSRWKSFPPWIAKCISFVFWQDMKKFGGPNKIRQKCRLRQCLNFVSELLWFH